MQKNSAQKTANSNLRPLTSADLPNKSKKSVKVYQRKATRKTIKTADELLVKPAKATLGESVRISLLMTVKMKPTETAPGTKQLATRGVRVAKCPGVKTSKPHNL